MHCQRMGADHDEFRPGLSQGGKDVLEIVVQPRSPFALRSEAGMIRTGVSLRG